MTSIIGKYSPFRPFVSSEGSSAVENRRRDMEAGFLDGRISTSLDAARN
jgi:hypothetical protein